MADLHLTFLGTGDAFGSGGRLQTCFALQSPEHVLLIDCGASALISMKRFGMRPEHVDVIVCSHLHGDHIGGIPFLVRETQIAQRRERPLLVAGPEGIVAATMSAMEAAFPGSTASSAQTFPLRFLEYGTGVRIAAGPAMVESFRAVHSAGTNPHSLRVELEGHTIAYSGDTEWTDALAHVARGADLFICEAYTPTPVPNHMDYETLLRNRARLECRALRLTHAGAALLAQPDLELPLAFDGESWSVGAA